jgi:hypothetical protein
MNRITANFFGLRWVVGKVECLGLQTAFGGATLFLCPESPAPGSATSVESFESTAHNLESD